MRNRLTLSDSGDLLVEEEHAEASGDELKDTEGPVEYELGRGYARFIVLDGLVIVRGTHTVNRHVVLQSYQDPPNVEVHFALEGGVVVHAQGIREPLTFNPLTHVLHYTPDSRLRFALAPDMLYDRFEINFSLDYFASLAERYPMLFEDALAQIERNQPFCLSPSGPPITPRMNSVVQEILESRAQGPLRRMFIDAKVSELLALQFQQHEDFAMLQPGQHRLKPGDVERMHEARHLLLDRLDDPPTLARLARQVGTNEFALKRDFKALFGKTVYGMLLDHKLEYARSLILDTQRPIAAIAQEVGYSHPAHFSTAFKRQFGVSPSSMRKVTS